MNVHGMLQTERSITVIGNKTVLDFLVIFHSFHVSLNEKTVRLPILERIVQSVVGFVKVKGFNGVRTLREIVHEDTDVPFVKDDGFRFVMEF